MQIITYNTVKRRSMTRADLANNGIYFFESYQYPVPESVNILRESLLDFFCTIIDQLGIYHENAFQQPSYLLPILRVFDETERMYITSTIERHEATKKRAFGLQRGGNREREWANFFYECFFSQLASYFDMTKVESRWAARLKFYYDRFEYAHGRPWSLFSSQLRRDNQQTSTLIQPTPDLTAHFPIYDFESDRPQWPCVRWLKDSIVENFSRATLQRLCKHGLASSVTGFYYEGRQGEIDSSNSICFPWLIVEHKKVDQKDSAEVYCRAANDATAALMVFGNLAKYATDSDIPPVVALTTVGEIVRVWIAYYDSKHETCKMICIWKGFMTTIVDIVRLEAILENLHTWATRVLRPRVSHLIDQWKSHHPDEPVPKFHNADKGNKSFPCRESDTSGSKQATANTKVENDESIDGLLKSEPRPRTNSDPFPYPNAEFIGTQVDIESVLREAQLSSLIEILPTETQKPPQLPSDHANDDATVTFQRLLEVETVMDADIGVTDDNTTDQELDTNRKIMISETTGQRIRIKLPNIVVDHPSLRETADLSPNGSLGSDTQSAEYFSAHSSVANDEPPISPEVPFVNASSTSPEKPTLWWDLDFDDDPYIGPGAPEPFTILPPKLTLPSDPHDRAREEGTGSINAGVTNTSKDKAEELSSGIPETDCLTPAPRWPNSKLLHPDPSVNLDPPVEPTPTIPTPEASVWTDARDTSSKYELSSDPQISNPMSNNNYYSSNLPVVPEDQRAEEKYDLFHYIRMSPVPQTNYFGILSDKPEVTSSSAKKGTGDVPGDIETHSGTENPPAEAAPTEASISEGVLLEAAPTETAPVELASAKALTPNASTVPEDVHIDTGVSKVETETVSTKPAILETAFPKATSTEAGFIEVSVPEAPIEAAHTEAASTGTSPTEVASIYSSPVKAGFRQVAPSKDASTQTDPIEAAPTEALYPSAHKHKGTDESAAAFLFTGLDKLPNKRQETRLDNAEVDDATQLLLDKTESNSATSRTTTWAKGPERSTTTQLGSKPPTRLRGRQAAAMQGAGGLLPKTAAARRHLNARAAFTPGIRGFEIAPVSTFKMWLGMDLYLKLRGVAKISYRDWKENFMGFPETDGDDTGYRLPLHWPEQRPFVEI